MKQLSYNQPRSGSGYFKIQGENKDLCPDEVWVTVQHSGNCDREMLLRDLEKFEGHPVEYLRAGSHPNQLCFSKKPL